MKKSKVNWKILISCFAVVYLVAFLGSLFTSSQINTSWYQSIKPSITPPNLVFPVVWNILFFLISLSLYSIWTKANKKAKTKIAILFGVNLFLNLFWSFLFFYLKNPVISFFEVVLLVLSTVSIIYYSWKINKCSSYLLIPYLVWLVFAGVLNYLIAFG
jgi:tryptophan-rich sensory protein